MTVETAANAAQTIARLRQALTGRVITETDAEYDAARQIVYGGIDPRPAAIARVAGAADVATVIRISGESGMPFAVRSGGHSGAGHSTNQGGIVLDLRDMHALEIDAEARTAWAETGLAAIDVSNAAAEHGLAIGFGDTGSVGIGGITLGGGVGYLSRKHGLTIDNLLAADVVTADGRERRTDAETEADLFWAIRGGGGNFGVATRFQYRLHPLPSITGGILVLPANADTVAGFVREAEAAGEDFSAIANVMPAPPMPFLPEAEHGKLVILAIVCYAGDPAGGDAAIAPFRALASPLADLVQSMPYPGLFPPEDPDYHPLAISRNLFVDHVDGDVARTIMRFLEASDASMRVAQLRVLGGAIARVPADATAYAHRSSPIMVNVASFYEGEGDRPRRAAWVDDFAGALDQGDLGVYVNFLADEGPDRVRAAYPGRHWERLAEIKARYDPSNVFRSNQNIPPATDGHATT